jgi:neutral amino acid transport system permease protein
MTGKRDPSRYRKLWRDHGQWAIGIVVLLAILAYLRPDWTLVIYVAALAGLYRWITTTKRFSKNVKENLVFILLVGGLLGLMWTLMGQSNAALLTIMGTMLLFALFALGLNLQFGYTGIINFGHVAFMGIGAYTVAVITFTWIDRARHLQEPIWGGVLIALFSLVAFIVVGVATSLIAGEVLKWMGASLDARRRTEVVSGLGGGLLAVVLVVWVVPFPLTPMWAMTFFLAGAALLGMVFAAVAGTLLGLPALRLRADYLAIVTIGAAEILRRAFLNESWLTRGPLGLSARRGQRPFDHAFGEWAWPDQVAQWLGMRPDYTVIFLFSILFVVLVVYLSYEILARSPYGRSLRAVREDEDLATALGKNVFSYKLQVMAIGGAVAALSGAFLLWQRQTIVPDDFHPLITFYAWIIVVIGGAGSNKGTILGAVTFWTIFEGTRFLGLGAALGLTLPQESAMRTALIGLLLILLMLYKPEGILGRREEMVLEER